MSLSGDDRGTLDALYATFVPEHAPPGGARAMGDAIERLAPHRMAELRRFLALLRTPVLCLALVGKPQRFEALQPQQRERALQAMAEHPLSQLRTAYQAMKRLALFIAYSYEEDVPSALWAGIEYPGPRTDLPAVTLELPLAEPQDLVPEYDVVIIGSGAGGGVAAGLCADAGMRVLVLEMGPPVAATARRQRELDAFTNLYLDSGLTSTEDLAFSILAGSCVGGGTSVNWSTSLRLSSVVAKQWSAASGGIDFDDSLAQHYRAVGERLSVAPTLVHNRNNAVLKAGAEALDWRGYAHPRNAAGCGAECGYCGFGCAYDRKQSTARTYLRDAVERGASVIAGARAERILTDGTHVRGIEVTFIRDGSSTQRTIATTRVIVACGALRTPGILAKSGIRSPHLGAHLRLHPVTGILAEFEDDIEPWNGPIQSYLIDEFGDLDDGYGVKLEAVPAHPGLAALALPWRSRAKHEADLRKLRKRCALIALVRDRGEGKVSADGLAKITYRLGAYDGRHMRVGMRRLAQAALAAGATAVETLHTSPLRIEAGAPFAEFERKVLRAPLAPNRIGLFSAHQMGTARMHADRRSGVVDAYGRLHGHNSIVVADSAVFPLASGVNPMLTIMALARRSIAHQIDHW